MAMKEICVLQVWPADLDVWLLSVALKCDFLPWSLKVLWNTYNRFLMQNMSPFQLLSWHYSLRNIITFYPLFMFKEAVTYFSWGGEELITCKLLQTNVFISLHFPQFRWGDQNYLWSVEVQLEGWGHVLVVGCLYYRFISGRIVHFFQPFCEKKYNPDILLAQVTWVT